MNAHQVQLAPIPVVMYRHMGPYETLSPKFDQLWEWVEGHGVPAQRTIGIYWDNPDYVPASRLRSAACVEVPPYFQLPDRAGLPISLERIAGGSYMTTTFVGPYEDLAPVWTQLTSYIETRMGLRISNNPAFEVYVNDAGKTPPDQLVTELYMPLA
jgi:AraC family transcriptional regulator